MPEEGEVYWDNSLTEEVTVLESGEDQLLIEHESIEPRDYPKWQWRNNESCGRFEKLREVGDVDIPEQKETDEKASLFDF